MGGKGAMSGMLLLLYGAETRDGSQLIPRPAERGSWSSVIGMMVWPRLVKGSWKPVVAWCRVVLSRSAFGSQTSFSVDVLPKPKSKDPILLATSEDVLSGNTEVSFSGSVCKA